MSRPNGPSRTIKLVTPSDTADLPDGPCDALLVGTAGDARLILGDASDTGGSNLVPLQAGYNPISVQRVYSTGATAARIWAIYL